MAYKVLIGMKDGKSFLSPRTYRTRAGARKDIKEGGKDKRKIYKKINYTQIIKIKKK